MNHGVVEQIGTPMEIYRNPSTAFVADFIGTMNFMPGEIVSPNRARLGQVELACEAEGMSAGTGVTVALRPEDVVVREVDEEAENSLQVEIQEMEFLGSFFRVDLASKELGEARLRGDFSINLVREKNLKPGDSLPVHLPSGRIRIYPAEAV